MARDISIERNAVIDAAIGIIEESGAQAVSARTVANRLRISTQPIYREFGDMDGLRRAALKRAFDIFWESIRGEAADQSVGYVRFACEHGELFKFMFMGKHYEYTGLDDLAHALMPSTDIIERLMAIFGLSEEKTYKMHLFVWMAIHGLAVISADNKVRVDDTEIKDFTVTLSRAMAEYLKSHDRGGDKQNVRA